MGTHPGGVHLEMTGEDVTECIGGNIGRLILLYCLLVQFINIQLGEVLVGDLGKSYFTTCDPRLNGNQALELSFLIAERMRLAQGLQPLFNCPI
jgi:3-deoxy-7-phosphoheptulonate synthase